MGAIRRFSTSGVQLGKVIPKNLKGKSVSSQMWLQRQLNDPYVEKAKMMNYRCRSAFKLLEIDEKYGILRPGQTIIDCGCAPGSWSQVAINKSNANGTRSNTPTGLVIGVDLVQVYPLEGAHLLGNIDFTSESGQKKIKAILGDKKCNVVLSDMAPKASGVKSLDQENISMLCLSVLRFALKMSDLDASVLMKIWSNPQMSDIEKQMKRFYKTVKIVKPNSSRSESAEQFLLGKGFVGLSEETYS